MDNIDVVEGNLYKSFKKNAHADFDKIENTLIRIYRELDNSEHYNWCVKLICYIADKKIKDQMIQQLLHDCIVKSRIFLYDDMLSDNKINYNPVVSPQDVFLRGFYTSSKSETTLTKPQKEIFNTFQKNRRLIVSAPTSFGKTRIIREIISHNSYNVIVIIMPTISLLSEAYHDFKNEFDSHYVVSKSPRIKIINEKKYIIVLTPERMSVLSQDNPALTIDFFVMDEVYKADYKLNDERVRVFADVLYRLTKSGSDLYLIGPYINDFSKKFREKFNIIMLKYDLEIVQKDYYEFDNKNSRGKKEIEGVALTIVGDKYKNLLRVTQKSNVDGKFLIYRYQKRYVEELAEKFLDSLPLVSFNQELINYLEQNISETWSLNDCLKKGVAFHHGAMPRHIQDLIIDEFNSSEGNLKYIFCTTSLTEGINSTAKNVILYDLKIGNGEPLANLDRRNIEGRAGRFMRHFLGRVFYFEKVEKELDKVTNVEIEFIDSSTPDMETLVQLEERDIAEDQKAEFKSFVQLLKQEKIPLSLLKEKKFVSLTGQISLINHLRDNNNFQLYHYISQRPTLDKTEAILSVIYHYLFTENNKGQRFNSDKSENGKKILLDLTKYYIYQQPSFHTLLNSSTMKFLSPNENARIRLTFDTITKYFEFIWPRYFKAFEILFNFVAVEKSVKPLSLDYIVAILEYGTNKNHEIILRDAGIPKEMISKVSDIFVSCEGYPEVQEIFNKFRGKVKSRLSDIEFRIFCKYV